MRETDFPRTTIGGVSVSRMIIGTNWMNGYSHKTSASDQYIRSYNQSNASNLADMIEVFLNAGVDTILGGIGDEVLAAIHTAEERTGRKVILINTVQFDVSDTREGRQSAERVIEESRAIGSTFCFPFHGMVEQLVCKEKRTMDRLPDYLEMIRERGMIPGLSAHMPEVVMYCDEQGYDVETYIQLYNCMGFLMQMEIETINRVIWEAKKPVMTIKPMAAGRVTPFVGLNFSWNTLRECDMVAVGCLTPQEAAEVIEISRAALARRRAGIEGRGSLGGAVLERR